MGGAVAKTALDQSHQWVLISNQIDVFLTAIKLCHSNKIVGVVWISGIDSYSFSRERPLSTRHMHHHHTIRENINLENTYKCTVTTVHNRYSDHEVKLMLWSVGGYLITTELINLSLTNAHRVYNNSVVLKM